MFKEEVFVISQIAKTPDYTDADKKPFMTSNISCQSSLENYVFLPLVTTFLLYIHLIHKMPQCNARLINQQSMNIQKRKTQ